MSGLRYQLRSIGFKKLTGLLAKAGLLGTLSGEEEFTVFAPKNDALRDFLTGNPDVAESLKVTMKAPKITMTRRIISLLAE